MTDHDFDTLIAMWLDGRLDAEGSQAIQQQLRESAAARAMFHEYAHLDAALYEIADTSGMLDPSNHMPDALGKLPSHAQQDPAKDLVDAKREHSQVTLPPTRISGKRPTAFGRVTSWYTAFAVGILLTVSLFSYFNTGERREGPAAQLGSSVKPEGVAAAAGVSPRKPPAPVATLASADRAVWEKPQLEIGQALYEGQSISLQQGEARISVGFGAEIVADAPFSLTFLASDRIELHYGEVAVDVAPWAAGFTVVTEEMDIVDLGTTFTVSASPGVKSETTVLKGVVRVHPSKVQNEQRRGMLISEGQRISIDGRGSFKNIRRKDVKQLLSRLDFGSTAPYRPVVLNNTGLGLAVGDEDLHWKVVAGPSDNFGGPQFASVCVPERGYLSNSPEISQWVSVADWQTAAPNSIYTFQTVFDLESYDLSTMQLFGRFLADNGVAAVRVNGESVEVQSWVDNVRLQPFSNPQFRFINVTKGLVEDRNVIEVDVFNGMIRKREEGELKRPPLRSIPNPMALRVEWYAFGRQQDLANVGDGARLLRQLQDYNLPMSLLSRSVP